MKIYMRQNSLGYVEVVEANSKHEAVSKLLSPETPIKGVYSDKSEAINSLRKENIKMNDVNILNL